MSWRAQQADFRAALLAADRPAPKNLCASVGPGLERRFNVYRNNVVTGLVEALMATYPVVTQLVGDEFMRETARLFALAQPPRSPVLLDYGESFAAFLHDFEPAAALPYLADVARLEWAWLCAYHAADAEPLDISHLGKLAGSDGDKLQGLTIGFLPSVHLLAFDHPALSIWAAHQHEDGCGSNRVDLSAIGQAGEFGLIARPEMQVDVRPLSKSAYDFFKALQQGQTLGEAMEFAMGVAGVGEGDFDPAALIAALFELQLVASINHKKH